MSKTYIILASVLILVALGLVFLPDTQKREQIPPEKLLKEVMSSSRFVSPDLVARRLIDEDPAILLVDVRPGKAYTSYSLPGAINIPLENILSDDWKPYLDQNDVDIVFFSNDDLQADQAWILCSRLGYENLYVMEGGLNRWFAQIMQPEKPPVTASSDEFDLYTFRKAAGMYFGGGTSDLSDADNTKEDIKIIKRTKKTVTAGGC